MKGLFVKKFFSLLFLGTVFAFPAESAAPKHVFMALWDGCEDACQGFLDALNAQNIPVELTVRDVGKDSDKIPALVDEIKQSKPDLLATWGTLLTLKLAGTQKDAFSSDYVTSVPTVFMVVSHPVESGLVPALSAQGRNITGVSHLASVSEQLQAARQFYLFDRMGIIFDPMEANAESAVRQVKEYASLMNFDVIERKLPMDKNKRPDASKIPALVAELAEQKAGLIYLPPDAFMNAHRDALTRSAFEAGIPVFSASEGAVAHGQALFAYVHRYYTVGLLAGQKAVRILQDGVPAYDIPIETPNRGVFVVNMTAARQLEIYPPLNFIQAMEPVDIPENQ